MTLVFYILDSAIDTFVGYTFRLGFVRGFDALDIFKYRYPVPQLIPENKIQKWRTDGQQK